MLCGEEEGDQVPKKGAAELSGSDFRQRRKEALLQMKKSKVDDKLLYKAARVGGEAVLVQLGRKGGGEFSQKGERGVSNGIRAVKKQQDHIS